MDWLIGKREKSLARNAQLAVKNMHTAMDKQVLQPTQNHVSLMKINALFLSPLPPVTSN